MEQKSEMIVRDVFVKLTDPSRKKPTVINSHRVYDIEKFLAAQKQLHEQAKDEADRRTVTLTTEADYKAFKGYREQ